MKAKYIFITLLLVAAAAFGGWYAAKRSGSASANGDGGSGRKVLYYQSSMHPWIKSDKPGNCTICGMKLVPVYEGEAGFEVSSDVVTLSSNTITVINVQTEEVRRRPLTRTIKVAGTIEDNDARHRVLSAYVDGRIDELSVNYVGAEVVEGQPLATIYSPMLRNEERNYVSLLTNNVPSVPGGLPLDRERMIAGAELRLRQLGLNETQIKALQQKAETNIHTEILAPMTGTVVARFVYAGQYVKEGDKLFELADFSRMWLLFDAYERDLAWIEPGDKVEVTTRSVPGKVFQGVVNFIDPNVRDMTRSAKVRVEIENPLIEARGQKRRELYHRLYAEARVLVDVPEVLAVPRNAVLQPGTDAVVYVDQGGGSYQQRRVRLGRMGDEAWEVLEGLSEGERIVTNGNMLIDSQAQLNQSANQPVADAHQHGPAEKGHEGHAPPTTGNLPKLSPEQQQAAKSFVAVADAVTEALAADKLDAFNAQAMKLHTAVPALKNAFVDAEGWDPLVQKIDATGHLSAANDLAGARKAFLPFSMATVEFVKALRKTDAELARTKVYVCPMVNQAVPGAAKNGFWVQAKGPLRNPYFGAEMLDCGNEVKP